MSEQGNAVAYAWKRRAEQLEAMCRHYDKALCGITMMMEEPISQRLASNALDEAKTMPLEDGAPTKADRLFASAPVPPDHPDADVRPAVLK